MGHPKSPMLLCGRRFGEPSLPPVILGKRQWFASSLAHPKIFGRLRGNGFGGGPLWSGFGRRPLWGREPKILIVLRVTLFRGRSCKVNTALIRREGIFGLWERKRKTFPVLSIKFILKTIWNRTEQVFGVERRSSKIFF